MCRQTTNPSCEGLTAAPARRLAPLWLGASKVEGVVTFDEPGTRSAARAVLDSAWADDPRLRQIVRRRAAMLSTVAVLLLSACTQDAPELPPASTITAVRHASFPLRVVRNYVDPTRPSGRNVNLAIQSDGNVLGRAGDAQVTCTLNGPSLESLSAAAARIEGPTPTTPKSQTTADAPVLTWLGSGGTSLVEITDPRIGAAARVIEQLLEDVSARPGERLACL